MRPFDGNVADSVLSATARSTLALLSPNRTCSFRHAERNLLINVIVAAHEMSAFFEDAPSPRLSGAFYLGAGMGC